MANQIENEVTLRGNKHEIEKFFEECFDEQGNFDFNRVIPQPKTKNTCPNKYICDPQEAGIEPCEGREWFDWFSWNYDNWGVKWNAYYCYTDKENNYFEFTSPWDSPNLIFRALMEKYPNIIFDVDVDGEIDFPYHITYSGKQCKRF